MANKYLRTRAGKSASRNLSELPGIAIVALVTFEAGSTSKIVQQSTVAQCKNHCDPFLILPHHPDVYTRALPLLAYLYQKLEARILVLWLVSAGDAVYP